MTERPRDALGRPLPRDSVSPVEPVPQRSFISADLAWSEATAYLRDGLPFHAHEVLEQRWRCCPAQERDAWRAAAQWGAALTHRARGNDVGAERLAQRALDGLDGLNGLDGTEIPDAMDVERIRSDCADLLEDR